MDTKKLTIVDLENYIDLKINNSHILFANKGRINFVNSKIIRFDINSYKEFKKKYLIDIENFFEDLKKKIKIELKFFNPEELEIFNLRNDKINYFEKLFVILNLKKFANKFKYFDLITDNEEYLKIYTQIFENINVKIIKKKNYKLNIPLRFNFYKFLVKSIYFVFLSKIILSNNQDRKKKILSLSIFPYFYDKKKQVYIYNNEKDIKLNFSLTDETHLNLNIINYHTHISNLKKVKNILAVENFIKIKDYLLVIKKFNIDFKNLNIFLRYNKIRFKDLDIKNLIVDHIWISFLNRYKLSIYDKALNRILNSKKIKKFNYFLFEYSFGFYLSKIFKTKQSEIKTIGYQHGIFSKSLLWLNILKKSIHKNIYFPNKVICNQKNSLGAYKSYFKNVKFLSKRTQKNRFPKINTKSRNILVFPGQHDLYDVYNYFYRNEKFNNNRIFIKLHPNNKRKIVSESNNIKIVTKINYELTYKIYMSQTTTMVYMYKKLNKKFNLIKFNYKFNLQ